MNNLGHRLVADLYIAAHGSPVVAFSHGLHSGRRSPRGTAIAEGLREIGFSTLLFDYTGHGESEGSEDEATPMQMAEDLKYFLDALESEGFSKIGLNGSSYGGAAALMRTAEDERVRALVLMYSTMMACFDFKRPCYELAPKIKIPTLMIVGSNDHPILEENQRFLEMLEGTKDLHVIEGAVHAFEEPAQIEEAMHTAVGWFKKYLA